MNDIHLFLKKKNKFNLLEQKLTPIGLNKSCNFIEIWQFCHELDLWFIKFVLAERSIYTTFLGQVFGPSCTKILTEI